MNGTWSVARTVGLRRLCASLSLVRDPTNNYNPKRLSLFPEASKIQTHVHFRQVRASYSPKNTITRTASSSSTLLVPVYYKYPPTPPTFPLSQQTSTPHTSTFPHTNSTHFQTATHNPNQPPTITMSGIKSTPTSNAQIGYNHGCSVIRGPVETPVQIGVQRSCAVMRGPIEKPAQIGFQRSCTVM